MGGEGRGFLIYRSFTSLQEIISSEAYIAAVNKENSGKGEAKHTDKSKELLRKANLGKKLSAEAKQKLTLNTGKAKAIVTQNIETKEMFEFTS